ncbi:MAG: hypothetical protein U0Z44_08100 [Kouleothrix sp.]
MDQTLPQARDPRSDARAYDQRAPTNIVDLLVESKLAASKSEARRLIDGGGVPCRWRKSRQLRSWHSSP